MERPDELVDLLSMYIALRLCIATSEHPAYGGPSRQRIDDWKRQLVEMEDLLDELGVMRPGGQRGVTRTLWEVGEGPPVGRQQAPTVSD